jgi:hypothetical protein
MAKRTLRVFVASPGDVCEERDALAKLITELNLVFSVVAPEKEISLELVRWETDVVPSAGRPQAVINEQIGEYDIFVGVMWTRFGTPSGVAESGTEEECERAYEAWRQHGRPQIMFYFCQAPSPPPASKAQAEQLLSVVNFRQKLSEKALVWEYRSHSDFADTVRPHLLKVLRRAMVADEPARQAAVIPSSTSDLDFVRSQLLGLSAEYAKIRANMPSGDARTRQMEIIVTKMRSVALPATPLLRSLADSRVPGERLAAISILQVTPQTEYIEWLGERCLEGQPFLVYHAAVALLTSARTLDCVHRPRLEKAIQKGLAHLGNKQSTDRYRALAGALEELRARCPQS